MVCKYATYAAQQEARESSKFHQEESSLNNIIWAVIQLIVLWPRICHNESAVATNSFWIDVPCPVLSTTFIDAFSSYKVASITSPFDV